MIATRAEGSFNASALTRVHDDQHPSPFLVDLGELGVLNVEHWGGVVEVVFERFIALDVDGALGVLGDGCDEIRHGEISCTG